jgi:phospholipid/cholesterol/gamma-HCH transport system ATP-binding protein
MPPLPAPTLIDFEHVDLAFGGQPVLEDVSFAVRRSETKVLLGETGSGKSVLLKLAIGLLRPDAGRVEVLGETVSRLPEEDLYALRRRIGIVFQESALFDSLTVRENVAYRLEEERRLSPDEIEARVRACLAAVELEDAIDKMPAELSGGMQRRVSIARALSTEPEILLYDSPTGGLDPVTSTTIMELVMKERDVHATPSLMVTHRLQDAFMLCTHRFDAATGTAVPLPKGEVVQNTSFLMLEEGRLIFDGSIQELLHSENPFVREFLE